MGIVKGLLIALTLAAAWLSFPAAGITAERTVLKGGRLSFQLPATWKKADKPPAGEEVLGAFQSRDNTSSLFVTKVTTSPGLSLPAVMDGVVENFEKGLIVNRIGKTKDGELAGVFAVFCTLELEVPSATTRERKPFRFYLTIFETGSTVYLIQGSVQQPVKKEREQEVLAIIRSVESAVQ